MPEKNRVGELLGQPRKDRRGRRQQRRRRHAGAGQALPKGKDKRDRQDAEQDFGDGARIHDVPTAISCTGSAQATSQARSRSNRTSMMKPSAPMMTIMA